MSDLAYPQKQALQRQQSNLKSFTEALKKEYADLKPEDLAQKALAPQVVTQLTQKIDDNLKKVDAYVSDLDKNQCPKDNPDVAALLKAFDEQKAYLNAMKAALAGVGTKVAEFTDMAKYPNFEADLKKLEEMEDSFRVDGSLMEKPVDMVQALSEQFMSEVEYINGIPKTYAPLINLKTPQGLQMQAVHTKAAKAMMGFQAKQDEFKTAAEAEFAKQLQAAKDASDRAVQGKAAALFTGQAMPALERARLIMERLQVIPRDSFKDLATKFKPDYEAGLKDLESKKTSLKESLLAATEKPKDIYKGDDRADLEKKIKEAWIAAYASDEILGILFPMENWKRTDYKKWDSASIGWDYHSYSELAARLVVKTSDTVATIYNVLMVKNHMQNDQVSFDVKRSKDPKGGLVIEEMLMANWS